jgi:hypothetical protein
MITGRIIGNARAERDWEIMSDDTKLMSAKAAGEDKSSFEIQKFAFGQRIGLQTDSSETSVIIDAIDALTLVENDLSSILAALFGTGSTGDKPKFGYDPSAKWLAGVEMTINVLSINILLVDGQFYGLLVTVAGDGPFKGLSLEIIYRKINDHLGEFSADLTLPDKFRKFNIGAASLTLPIISLQIWTNGDFKINIGWPLGDRSFAIAFPPDPIPWAGGGGFYFGKLRSEDMPGQLGTGFNPIIEFGIALKIGAATEGNYGVLSYGASIYLFGTFQGFLAWAEGESMSDGLDYYWFCASVGITGHLEGSVDFVVISVSVSLDITASVTMALEKNHATYALAEFTATVEASIKILFIRIHFSFTLDVKVSVTFGSGPVAQISGPTPNATSLALDAMAEQKTLGGIAEDVMAVAGIRAGTKVGDKAGLAAPPPAIPVSLSYMLQPSIRYNGSAWVSVGVASLVIDRTAPSGTESANLGLGTDSFSLLVGSLASYLLQTYGNYTDPTGPVTAANLQALQIALGGDPSQCGGQAQTPGVTQFTLQSIYTWLTGSNIQFTVTGTSSGSTGPADGAIFPVIPGLTLTYNGAAVAFGDGAAPQNYLTVLDNYFAELSLIGDGSIDAEAMRALLETESVATAGWMPGVIFSDYFNILAKQLCTDLCDLESTGTLAADLALIDVGNMAGIVTRFLQHGLRLPDPSDLSAPIPTMNTLPLYDLTGQQFDIASVSNAPVTTAVLSGTTSVNVTIAGDGSATLPFVLDQAPTQNPLWTPQPLDRINYAQASFMLRQGVAWAETGTNWQMFGLPDTLQSQLRLADSLSLTLSATDGNSAPVSCTGMSGLKIGFSLSQVPKAGGGFEANIFQVAGTDDGTRDLMELLFASQNWSTANTVEFLWPAGAPNSGSGYNTSAADSSVLIFKTNLSTYNQPNASMMLTAMRAAYEDSALPDLGATYAPISDVADFLLLMWECSVIHSGGFYLYVPDDLQFGTSSQIDVALMVKSSGSTSANVALTSYQNTILVNTALTANDRVQGLVFQSDGITPVTDPKPNYPAGTIAFGASWTGAPTDVTAGDTAGYSTVLYQMLEFQIAPGAGLANGSGWSMPLGPNTSDGNTSVWDYKRAVPVYRFVEGVSNPPNRYAAIGLETTLNLQLVDIFGNAYGLNPLQTMAVYNDQLIPIDEWPGAYVLYSFTVGTEGSSAILNLTVTFEPDQITQKETSLAYYQIIYDQLTDPRTGMSLTTAMAAAPVAVTATGNIGLQASLTSFVAQIMAYLAPGSTTQPPANVTLSGSVSTSYITTISEDLFPLWVSLTTTRNAPAEKIAYDYPDGFLSVVSQLPPLLNTDPADTASALRQWSIGFEQAFYSYDGSKNLLKVLTGTAPTKVTATRSKLGASAAGDVTSVPGDLWALKWGESNGVEVDFGNSNGQTDQQPVYFAPVPLSTELVSANVQVTPYDAGTGNPGAAASQTFSGMDMDGMGSSFLQAFDSLLNPELANAIAQLDVQQGTSQYKSLMTAKEQLASAISNSISWVFQDQMPNNGGNGSNGMGDLTSAQTRFRENLLLALGSDFTTSVIVQLPATVTVNNQFEPDPSSQPPDFFGNPSPVLNGVSQSALNQYTISTSTLPIQNGAGYLNFLVGAIDPTIKADLEYNFAYNIGFIDHQFQTSEEQFGYTPSSWLRFIVPDVDPSGAAPVLGVSMGQLDIPIPLRAYPSPPRLVEQNATQAGNNPPTTIGQAIDFDYNLTIARPQVAQDDLHLSIEFNGATAAPMNVGSSGGDALFAALANFQVFQAQYLPAATQAILTKALTAKQWLTDIVALVQAVATAWQGEDDGDARMTAEDDVQIPAPFSWDFKLQIPDETTPNVMVLSWTDQSAPPASAWPLINNVQGQSQTPAVGPYTYTLLTNDPNLDQPTITWPNLSVITNQSVTADAWIERNETLAGDGGPTNPAFVYTTSKVSFPSPVIPLLNVPTTITLTNTTSVNDAISQLVTQFMQPTSPISQVGVSLEADYSFVLVAGGPGKLQTKLPVYLVKTALSTDTGTLPAGVQTPQNLITALEGALQSWYSDFNPSNTNASLLFELTIFAANSQQPLARLLDIEAPISGPSWWTPPT